MTTTPRLSVGQERLWFLQQFEADSPVYQISAAFHLTGRLDRAALAQGLDAVIRRHDVLRARSPARDGQPLLLIAPALPLTLPRQDLSALAAAARAAELRRLMRTSARRPFDLARGPLLRAELMRLAGDDHVLLLSCHQLIEWNDVGTAYPADGTVDQLFAAPAAA